MIATAWTLRAATAENSPLAASASSVRRAL